MSMPYEQGHSHLRSWVIEGSNGEDNWTILDTVNENENISYLNGNCDTHLYQISNMKSESYRIIRLRQTGKSWSNSECLTLNLFELYGQLI